MKQADINITGRVQGVFFRSEAQNTAKELGISGWVKNEPDGSISMLAQGEEDSLNAFLTWCKSGPEGAEVKNIEIKYISNPKIILVDFKIK